MGLVDFAVGVGRKVGLFGGRAAAEAEQAKVEAVAAMEKAKTASDAAAKQATAIAATAADLKAAILSYVAIQGLDVDFDGKRATIKGTAQSQADKEKAVLVAGNSEGVSQVDDQLVVVVPEPPSVYHTIMKGETLSELAGRYYGVIGAYDAIFVANQPMLRDPDEIYPGQVVRVPPIDPPVHTVARGETLGTIAKKWYGEAGRYKDIAAANSLVNPDAVDVGQKLVIPLIGAIVKKA